MRTPKKAFKLQYVQPRDRLKGIEPASFVITDLCRAVDMFVV